VIAGFAGATADAFTLLSKFETKLSEFQGQLERAAFELGKEWRAENPYRGNASAVKIGTSAYNQNCARCHGIEAISGGIAPDLRKIDNDCASLKDAPKKAACLKEIDDYFLTTVRHGRTRNGAVYMPPFEGVMNQEAIWSIKAYLETRRDKPM